MRVVGGELGGRPLWAPRGREIRPTSDRVREALFSILGDVGDARVLDLFCGTGALAIEALSRGAASAKLVDRDVSAAARNVEELGLGGRATLVRSEVTRFLRSDAGTYDLVFCDPPYRVAPRLGRELDSLLQPRVGEDARVIVESATDSRLELPSFALRDERVYGGTSVGFYGRGGRP